MIRALAAAIGSAGAAGFSRSRLEWNALSGGDA